jgi:hypothetical protein
MNENKTEEMTFSNDIARLIARDERFASPDVPFSSVRAVKMLGTILLEGTEPLEEREKTEECFAGILLNPEVSDEVRSAALMFLHHPKARLTTKAAQAVVTQFKSDPENSRMVAWGEKVLASVH